MNIEKKTEKNFLVTSISLIWKALIQYMHHHSLIGFLSLSSSSILLALLFIENSAKIHTYNPNYAHISLLAYLIKLEHADGWPVIISSTKMQQ